MPHLLLAGGGHAHLEVLHQLARQGLPAGWTATLLTREAASPYSGMLPGVVAGLYAPEEALLPAAPLARAAGAELVLDAVTGLDPARRLLHRAGGPPLAYDLLSLDTGARPELAGIPGAAEHALPVKPIDGFLSRLPALPRDPAARLAVVGGGAAGVELAFALRARQGEAAPVTLVAGASGLLPGFPARLAARTRRELAARRIALLEGAPVAAVTPEGLGFATRPPLPAEGVLWATAAAAPAWHAASGLPRDAAGFLKVAATLQPEGQPRIFVAGDAASFTPRPLPKSGVHAVRQGPVLARNLLGAMRAGAAPLPYRPQRDALVLLSLGDGRALGTRNGIVFGGRWAWWWKDAIDRRFMRRYRPAPA